MRFVLSRHGHFSHAGALQPCVAANISANGSILVVNERTFDDQTSTFRVLGRYYRGEGNRLNGPDSYWLYTLWSVVITNSGKSLFISCPYTLVTDDGEYLILIGSKFQNPLTIYRRREHPGHPFIDRGPDHGVLIRQIPLRDLWPPEHTEEITDVEESTSWYAYGTFSFSPDNQTLIHKTRWGTTLHINLKTGDVISLRRRSHLAFETWMRCEALTELLRSPCSCF